MAKTRESFKKIIDTKETFHANIVTIKDRNGRDLTEAKDIMKEGARIHRRIVQKRSS